MPLIIGIMIYKMGTSFGKDEMVNIKHPFDCWIHTELLSKYLSI